MALLTPSLSPTIELLHPHSKCRKPSRTRGDFNSLTRVLCLSYSPLRRPLINGRLGAGIFLCAQTVNQRIFPIAIVELLIFDNPRFTLRIGYEECMLCVNLQDYNIYIDSTEGLI